MRNFKNWNKINFLQTGTSYRKMSLQCQWEVIVKTTEIHVMTVKGCEPRSKIAGRNLPKKTNFTCSLRSDFTNISQIYFFTNYHRYLSRAYHTR